MIREPFRGREAYAVWTQVTLQWSDNDVYGHVNNAVHYRWFDTAVNAWAIKAGLLDPGGDGPIAFVVETGCRFERPLSYPGLVEVGLAVEEIGRSSIRYRLGVFGVSEKGGGEDTAAAEGHFVHVLVGRKDRRPVPLPEEWRAALQAIAK